MYNNVLKKKEKKTYCFKKLTYLSCKKYYNVFGLFIYFIKKLKIKSVILN